jgi:hypothetical protein
MSSSGKVAVVMGAGRSCTSGVAKGLHLAGFPMANSEKDLIGANPTQPHGHYEDVNLVRLNDRILRDCKGAWNRPPLHPPSMGWVSEVSDYISQRKGVQWGMKDPRLVLTWLVWEKAFELKGIDVILIKVYRDVDRVAKSLTTRDGTTHEFGVWLTSEYHHLMKDI